MHNLEFMISQRNTSKGCYRNSLCDLFYFAI